MKTIRRYGGILALAACIACSMVIVSAAEAMEEEITADEAAAAMETELAIDEAAETMEEEITADEAAAAMETELTVDDAAETLGAEGPEETEEAEKTAQTEEPEEEEEKLRAEYRKEDIDRKAYRGEWLEFEPGFQVYVPADWRETDVSGSWISYLVYVEDPRDSGRFSAEDFSDVLQTMPEDRRSLDSLLEEIGFETSGRTVLNGIEADVDMDREGGVVNVTLADGDDALMLTVVAGDKRKKDAILDNFLCSVSRPDDEKADSPENETEEDTVYEDPEIIRKVQQALNEAGFDCGEADGIAGRRTKQAVADFLASKGMESDDGKISRKLLEALDIETD